MFKQLAKHLSNCPKWKSHIRKLKLKKEVCAEVSSQWFQFKRVGVRLETLVWRVVAKYQRKQEEFTIQSGLQVENKTSTTINNTRI